jgi:Tfp pilus assembly protein PilE
MRQESGRSMIEMIGVLAIMMALTATAIATYNYAMNMQKRSAVNENVSNIVTGVRELLKGYDDFSNIDNSTIFAAMSMSNKNPYGGTYELSVNPTNTHQFIVQINGLSKSDCEALLTKAWTDSVGYMSSNHKESGATGRCVDGNQNVVSITYGE